MPRAFVFDAYGTLFDVHAAIGAPSRRGRTRCRPLLRDLAHQAARIHLDADARRPLRRFLDADRARARLRVRARAVGRPGAAPALLDAYLTLDAFADARAVLRESLKARRRTPPPSCRTARRTMLAAAVEAAGIGGDLDAVLSVDTIRIYKPRPEVYALVTERFRLSARRRRLRLVEPLGRDGRGGVRLPHRLGQSRRDAGRISRPRARHGARDLTGLVAHYRSRKLTAAVRMPRLLADSAAGNRKYKSRGCDADLVGCLALARQR